MGRTSSLKGDKMKFRSVLLRIFIALFVLVATPSYANDSIIKVTKPSELNKSSQIPKELEGLQWNRWTSKNFTVCCLNDVQAQYLHKHLELVKTWTFARWGLYDIDFSTNCKIIGVDNPDLFKKFFNLDSTKVEIIRDSSGHIKETVIFLLITDKPSHVVPIPLTEVCMAEFAQKYNANFSMWSIRGMSLLNGTFDQIRERISEVAPLLDKEETLFFTKKLMEMDREQYLKLSENKKRLYDNCALMLCLMIRKEYGQDSYLKLIKTASEKENAVKKVLKFGGYQTFDKAFKRYMTDLTKEVISGKTPDRYLQIKEID